MTAAFGTPMGWIAPLSGDLPTRGPAWCRCRCHAGGRSGLRIDLMSVWAGLLASVSQICRSPQLLRAYATTPSDVRCRDSTTSSCSDSAAGALVGFLPPACRHISPKRRAVVAICDTTSVVIATLPGSRMDVRRSWPDAVGRSFGAPASACGHLGLIDARRPRVALHDRLGLDVTPMGIWSPRAAPSSSVHPVTSRNRALMSATASRARRMCPPAERRHSAPGHRAGPRCGWAVGGLRVRCDSAICDPGVASRREGRDGVPGPWTG
jgi:hypothetical protein